MNIDSAIGDEITINRSYLAHLLTKMEKSVYREAYERAYSQGYDHALLANDNELPIDEDFKGKRTEW
ncbi:hypothetical protein ACRCJU_02830 [Aerococcus urinaeequi]|uniref:hypothetical protein n=1 Tax=Aerococcus urinaeequi TaxID=51665 RepID=UPI003D6C0E8D